MLGLVTEPEERVKKLTQTSERVLRNVLANTAQCGWIRIGGMMMVTSSISYICRHEGDTCRHKYTQEALRMGTHGDP